MIDGGNSHFKDDVRRAASSRAKGVHYVDVGTSGGVWGLERGYCLMIGGDPAVVQRLEPIFADARAGTRRDPRHAGPRRQTSTAEEGYLHCGPAGSGHFVKMIHNGIEYGLMQAYAEGFDILRNANSEELPEEHRFDLDLADIAEVWRRGSVVTSWLLDLTAIALAEGPDLAEYTGFVQDSGEGRWTVEAAIEEAVPADVLTASLFARFRSRQEHTFGERCCRRCARSSAATSRQAVRRVTAKMAEAHEHRPLPIRASPRPPCAMVIFGASGDLTKRKLIPALYNLARQAAAGRLRRGRRGAHRDERRGVPRRRSRRDSQSSPPARVDGRGVGLAHAAPATIVAGEFRRRRPSTKVRAATARKRTRPGGRRQLPVLSRAPPEPVRSNRACSASPRAVSPRSRTATGGAS